MKSKKKDRGTAPQKSEEPAESGVTTSLFASSQRYVRRSSLDSNASLSSTPRQNGSIVAKAAGGKIGQILSTNPRETSLLMSAPKKKKVKREKNEPTEQFNMKENESVPFVPSSPQENALKKKKNHIVRESDTSFVVQCSPSAEPTNPIKKKKKKKKKVKLADNGMKSSTNTLESNDNAYKGAVEEEKAELEEDALCDMLDISETAGPSACHPSVNSEENADRPKRGKKLKKQTKKNKSLPAIASPESPPQQPRPFSLPASGSAVPSRMRCGSPRHSVVSNRSDAAPGKIMPTHIRFASESPEKPVLLNDKRATEKSSPNLVPDDARKSRQIMRDSSPEVSTTSSESNCDKSEERSIRRKILTKKMPAVKSCTMGTEKTLTTSSTEDALSSSGKKKKLKKKKTSKGKTVGVDAILATEQEQEGGRVRPSSDLLQMVAKRLANNHGLLVFRLISSETRRIAEQQLRQADSILHLEEFDDENAFTRDDMAQWWSERREAGDATIQEGKENRSHTQISAYLNMRAVEKRPLRDMDGGLSHPATAGKAVDSIQLLQHPLETLDAACLLHESQTAATARLLQQEGKNLKEVWLGHCNAKLSRELKRLTAIERFEHRQASMVTLERLPLLQMTELRIDIVDEDVCRATLADHLVNAVNLRALELNVAPIGLLDGNTASHYSLFTRRSYDRSDYTEELDWMIPNVEDGEPDPVTLCMPSLEHLATNIANVKLFWQLRDATLLLRHLQSLRVGTLSKTKELITSCELFADTKESRKYKQPGFFALRDAYETELESITLRLVDRVGLSRLQRDTTTMFEAIEELPPSLRRLSVSLFYNQFSGVCAPFRKWAAPDTEAPDTDHIGIEEMHLHFERAFDLRGLPALLPRAIKILSIAMNYENDDDARCLGSFIEMLSGMARLECLESLHIQVWGVRCLEPLVAALAACTPLSGRLTRLAVAAYPVDDDFFQGETAQCWLRASLPAFPRVRTLSLHAAVLARIIPEERRSGYAWRNGLAWLANRTFGTNEETVDVELGVAAALPVLDDGEDYTITPHWEVEYDSTELVLTVEEEADQCEDIEGASYSIPHGSSDDDFITDDEDDEDVDATLDDLDRLEDGLDEETERIERREQKRDEKERAALERGELMEEEEEEGDLIDFDSISDEEEEDTQPRSEFFDDEAVESDRVESEDEEEKQEESAESECSSEDDDDYREEERLREEKRREAKLQKKQAMIDQEVERKKRKRVFDSEEDDEEEDMVIRRKASTHKKKKFIIESDDE